MTYKNGAPSSDSVNLGSNPSSPATRNTDVSGVSCNFDHLEKPEISEQRRTAGHTKVGTARGKRGAFLLAHIEHQGDECLIWIIKIRESRRKIPAIKVAEEFGITVRTVRNIQYGVSHKSVS